MKKKLPLLVNLVCCLLIVSCSSQSITNLPQTNSSLEEPVSHNAQQNNEKQACSQNQSISSSTDVPLVENLNSLSIDLYSTIVEESQSDNLIFSPYGVASAFSVAYAGARQTTESEMAKVLHLLSQPEQHEKFRTIHCYLLALARDGEAATSATDSGYIPFQLEIANGMWGQQGFPFSSAYLDTVSTNYDAELQLVDFAARPTQVVDQINQWVSERTAGLIPALVSDNSVNQNTQLVIANAIYFKAGWLQTFDPSQTEVLPFDLLNDESVMTPLMQNGFIRAPYFKGEGYEAALLSYLSSDPGNPVEFLLVLPEKGRFANIQSQVGMKLISEIVVNAEPHDISLTMPKFEVKTSLDLLKSLKDMGLQAPFDPATADFSGLTDSNNGLYISAALQQATITVNEEGTEAAAATGIPMPVSGFDKAELIANRPFIYAIRERQTGIILFMGQVTNPLE